MTARALVLAAVLLAGCDHAAPVARENTAAVVAAERKAVADTDGANADAGAAARREQTPD